MKKHIQFGFILIAIVTSASVMADDFLKIELKNRSATSLKSVLSKLVTDDIKIITDGNSLILGGEMSTLTQLKKIVIDLDIASVSLSVSIYRGVDPNILKEHKGVKTWSTNQVSNRLDTVIIENGQRLVINETKLIVVPVASFGSRFDEVFDADNNLNDSIDLDVSETQLGSTFNRSEIIAIDSSLFVEPSLISAQAAQNKADTLKEKLFIRYSVPISLDDTVANKNIQQRQVLSTQTHILSQRVIHTNEWLQLSGHKVVSHRPSLSTNKKVVSTQKQTDSDNNIWIKVNRLN
jgi:hypothetical protein